MATKQYPNGVKNFLEGDIDLLVDTIKLALLNSTHAFNATHEFWSEVSANQVTADGDYSAGGAAVGTKSVSVVQSSALTAWQASTAYAVGDLVRATADNGHVFMCVTAGTSGGSQPTWDTDRGADTTDNTVVWSEIGAAIVKFTFAAVVWTSSATLGPARHAVLYKDTGSAATSPLIADDDFGSDRTASGGGTFTYTPDGDGMIFFGVGS